MNSHTALRLVAASLLFSVACVWAQPAERSAEKGSDFEDSGHRDSLVLIPDGSILLVVEPTDDQSGVAVQAADGTQTSLVDHGDCLGDCASGEPLDLDGVGSNPDMNNNGVVTFKGSFLEEPMCDPKSPCFRASAHGIFVGTPGGSLTTIAIGRDEAEGDVIDGDTFCDFEPMPRINENGQVFFGAHVDIDGGRVLQYDRWVAAHNNGSFGDGELNMCAGSRWLAPGEEIKGIYRYASGSIDTLLATQESSNLTTIFVTDRNFVNSNTTFAITDTHLNTQGAELANNLGHVVAYGMFDDDPDDDLDNCPPGDDDDDDECGDEQREYFRDDRMGLLYLRGENDRDLIAMAGPPG